MRDFIVPGSYNIPPEKEQQFMLDRPEAKKQEDGSFRIEGKYSIPDEMVDKFLTDVPEAVEATTAPKTAPLFDPSLIAKPDQTTEPSSLGRRVVGDSLTALAKSVVGFPQGIVGLGDLVTGGYAGKAVEGMGIKFDETQKILSDLYSPEAKAAQARVGEGFKEGVVPGLGEIFKNPSTIATGAIESSMSMLGGGALAKVALKAAPLARMVAAGGAAARTAGGIAGSIGEAGMAAGAGAEQVRQATENGLLTPQQAAVVGASGVLTGILGMFGNRAAKALGLADVDTLMAIGRNATPQATRGLLMQIIGGAVSEGVLEELPQSIQEQVSQNVALGKPWDEGVAESGAMGAVIGAVMGGGANLFAPATPPAPTTPAAEPTAPDVTPAPPIVPEAAPVVDTTSDEYVIDQATSRIERGDLDGKSLDIVVRSIKSPRVYELIAKSISSNNPTAPVTAEQVKQAHSAYLANPEAVATAAPIVEQPPADVTPVVTPEVTATPFAPVGEPVAFPTWASMTDEQKVDARAKVLDDPAQSAELATATAKVANREPLTSRDVALLEVFGLPTEPMSQVSIDEQQPLFNESKVPQEGPLAPSESETASLFGFQKPVTAQVEKPTNTKHEEIRRKIADGKVISSGEIAVLNEDGKPVGVNQEDLKEQGWEYNPKKKQLVRNEQKYSAYIASKQDAARRLVIEDPNFDATLKVANQKMNDGDPLTFPELRALEAAGRRPDKAGYVATRKNGIVRVEKKTTVAGIDVEKVRFVSDNGVRYEIYKSKTDGRTVVVMRNMSGDIRNNVIYTRIHESPSDAQFDVSDLISRRNNAGEFSRVAPGTQVSRLSTQDVQNGLSRLGFGGKKNVRVINDPAQLFDGRIEEETDPATKTKRSVFVLNAAYLSNDEQIQSRLEHEAIHQTLDDNPSVERVVDVLTDDEIKGINAKMTELGYTGDLTQERATRSAQLLYDEYKGKAWYQKIYAVAMTTLDRLGWQLNPAQKRVVASRMAAIAINRTINDIRADRTFERIGNDQRAIGLIEERSKVKGIGNSYFQKLKKFKDNLTIEGVQIDPNVSPQSAIAKPLLDQLSSVKTSALSEARELILSIMGGMTSKKLRHFNMLMAAREAVGTAVKDADGNMQLKTTAIWNNYADAKAALTDLVRLDNAVYGGDLQQRVAADLSMYQKLLQRGVDLGKFKPDILKNVTYIPHYTLGHFAEDAQDLDSSLHRKDGADPFLTDYLRYRWESMSKIIAMLNWEEAMQTLYKKIDTASVSRNVAKTRNMKELLGDREAEYNILSEQYASLSAVDAPTDAQREQMANLDSRIRTIAPNLWGMDVEMASQGNDLRAVLGYDANTNIGLVISEAASSKNKMVRGFAEEYLRAFAAREEFIKAQLGKQKYLEWGFNGSSIDKSIYTAKGQASVANKIKNPFQQSLKDGLKGFVGIDPNIIDQFFRDDVPADQQVEGGSQEVIVDQQIADALERIDKDSKRRHDDFFKSYKQAVKWWAISKTIAPLNIVPYMVTNFLTDSNHFISVMLSEDWQTKKELMANLPSMMKQAWKDSANINLNKKVITDPLLYLARKEGLIQMSINIQTGGLQGQESQGAFGVGDWKRKLEYAKAHPFKFYGQKAGEVTATFEDVLRIVYARHYLKQLNKGRSVYDIVHSVANPKTIEAILNDGNPYAKERAAILMAKSSAIDYTTATRAGQMMREYGVLPFYRWMEGNFFRQFNMLKNVVTKVNRDEANAAALSGATPNMLKVSAKASAAVAYRLVAMNLVLMMMRAYMKAVWPEEYAKLIAAGRDNFLIIGKNSKGEIKTIRAETAANAIWNAARSNPDLQNEPNNMDTALKGFASSPLTMARGAFPLLQLGGNVARGSAENYFTGKVQEKSTAALLAKEYGMESIINAIENNPTKDNVPVTMAKRLAPRLTMTDEDRLAYDNVVTSINRYLHKYGRGKTRTSDSGDQASAFIKYRRSLELGDEVKAKYWLEEYVATGGKLDNISSALKSKQFTDIFDKQYVNMWLNSKDTTDQERAWYNQAQKWLTKDQTRKLQTQSNMLSRNPPDIAGAAQRASRMIMDVR